MKVFSLFLLLFICVISAKAQLTLTVTRTDDRNTTCVSGVDCSLREAINAANAAPTNDTINFAIPSASCTSGVCTITLTSGELAINDAATAGKLTITNLTGASNLLISGNNASRVFRVNTGGNLTLNGLTVTNGNLAGFDGAGIYNFGGGTLTLTNSAVSGNRSGNNGGGIYNNTGTTTLTNSTVSGNTGNYGGGIISNGTLSLTNSTVAYNSAFNGGGGIRNDGSPAILLNTIVANNTYAASPDFSGAIASTSTFNLIGDGTGMSGITTNPLTGNQVGASNAPIDPKLDHALALNGGTTLNHALLSGSPAIDQGNATGTDQRGVTRPQDNLTITNATGGNGADIGAFEVLLSPTAATVSISGQVTTAAGRGIKGVLLSLTDSDGQIRTATTTSFGYYRFYDVQVGETYILSAAGKHYTFSQPVQVLNINEETDAVNFIADSEKRIRGF